MDQQKNVFCNCYGFQYNGSEGNPELDYRKGVVPGNMQYNQPNTACYNPQDLSKAYTVLRSELSNDWAGVF